MPCCVDDVLLCGEDAGELVQEDDDSSSCYTAGRHEAVVPGDYYDSDVSTVADSLAAEAACSPLRAEHPGRRPWTADRPGWSESVSWILKVRTYYGFQPATAYLAVSYMDRFLSSRSLPEHGWAFQLLSVACLSLAAKMEETSVPPLLSLQTEGTKFIFEPRTIQRMELLVLAELDWRLRSLTPFDFIHLFACKADPSGRCMPGLILRACQMILSAIHETEFLNHCPSSMAAAAVLHAVNETTAVSRIGPEVSTSWYIALTEDGVGRCYQVLQQQLARKYLVVLLPPQLRSMASQVKTSSPSKRRKLNGHFGEE